ncbi:RNA polymerase sigma factor (sigma-70 family) [Parabacteroides sp. PF5-5]|uniref:RNA polymerase sigma factor n=1 Tax=unclassified Parabacteroides TaxID=2649774 RepID=UPI0024769BA3|nr:MULTISPECIES: RNA polymerase sigma factor [unclassified Parabacteroides]MDH6304483.1 RNA polymerase sigma factor (sigma-70 family) [Parabacteroides sp. PH5-39]MDH6315364.1 RNA polymerase sigma factor (sigma-70 family) [Parabacteroides sp. PF5-13]MDH6319142.1 RNA polymerase sigma factor (sigma-70 family) [Parabacteroides sp. PH5-13]MDH6322872.1 RNA polymerase sigma factor (sigma-70 family) [Parabacteroides sp. PH5-8]MDH6326556.1 RNA polymerase sigma factor (sigma-70 family) [Parabacteroides 
MKNSLQFQQKLLSMQDNMMNFALLLTANKDDAQDLLQETTLKVLDNQDKFVDNVNFKGWVLTVMRNIFVNNYYKVLRAQTVIDYTVDLYNLDMEHDSGISSPDIFNQIQEITNAINNLDEELKIPFSMYLSGYKYNEIAEKLDVPMGTIKSRIFFARQGLRKELEDFLYH